MNARFDSFMLPVMWRHGQPPRWREKRKEDMAEDRPGEILTRSVSQNDFSESLFSRFQFSTNSADYPLLS
jgi:hypothetical protein